MSGRKLDMLKEGFGYSALKPRKKEVKQGYNVGTNYAGHTTSYEYFCGANVTIHINGEYLLDVAGITYNMMDSATPIYGYSSRLFDAVAPGQKIIQGTFVVNYRESNYVYKQMRKGRSKEFSAIKSRMTNAASDADVQISPDALKGKKLPGTPVTADEKGKAERDANEKKYWAQPEKGTKAPSAADPTLAGPATIEIKFAGGKYRTVIYGVFIVGQAQSIQIDENVLLEEYTFFARDLVQK